MVKRLAVLLLLVAAGCATDAGSGKCPSDSTALGFTLPSGFGVSVGESGLNAAYVAIRDFFSRNPAASQGEKARAADLAADAAAKSASKPMTEEERRALRSQAGEWVETYTEKCRPGS
jgi:hypothetical protein